jgi:hypothetical protein
LFKDESLPKIIDYDTIKLPVKKKFTGNNNGKRLSLKKTSETNFRGDCIASAATAA